MTQNVGTTGYPTRRLTPAGGFTLVELLVVIGIIAVLISILLPVLGIVRQQATNARCQSNMKQIYDGTMMYANENKDKFPDKYTLGDYGYRCRPGTIAYQQAGALPEVYGMAAVLGNSGKAVPSQSDVWVCRGAPEDMQAWGNTYAFSISGNLAKYTAKDRAKQGNRNYIDENMAETKETFVWDNFTMKPGLSGFRGPFGTGYTYSQAERPYPHRWRGGKKGVNDLYLDGSVATRNLP